MSRRREERDGVGQIHLLASPEKAEKLWEQGLYERAKGHARNVSTHNRSPLTFQVIGVTPSRQPWALDRPLEIADWVRSYNAAAERTGRPPIGFFVAVDDRRLTEENGGSALKQHFVWTDPREGLTQAKADAMVEVLHRPIDDPVLRPVAGASDACCAWPGGYVLLTRKYAQPPKESSESPVEYTCAFIASSKVSKSRRPSPWIVRDDAWAGESPSSGGALGRLSRRLLALVAPAVAASCERRADACADMSVSGHGHGSEADAAARRQRLDAEGDEEGRRVHGGSALLDVINSTGEEALAAGLEEEDELPRLAPGGVVGVLKKPSPVGSPRTLSPRPSGRGVSWNDAPVVIDKVPALSLPSCRAAETSAAELPEAKGPPAVCVSATGHGYGASSCKAVNAAVSPSATAATSPTHTPSGSTHGGNFLARAFGLRAEASSMQHSSLNTDHIRLALAH